MPVTRPVVSRQVFERLLTDLLAGRYEPGERLPPQRALAADLGVTVTALRESLKRLEQMGLIEVRHGDAMRVRDWRLHGGIDLLAPLLVSEGAALLRSVFEARRIMLTEMAGLAAARRTAAQARRLEELARRVGEAEDEAAAAQIDFAFFTELAEAAGNLVFVLVMNSIRALYFEHAERLPVTARHQELAQLYRRAAAAILRRQADAARRAVERLARAQEERVLP